jgi:hypothetical protein
VPVGQVPPKALLQRMAARMDEQLAAPSERRILTLPPDELLA